MRKNFAANRQDNDMNIGEKLRIHVLRTCLQVSTGLNLAYMTPVCLHASTCMSMYAIPVRTCKHGISVIYRFYFDALSAF